MSTVFTRIINGELPGRIVWQDETCAAFLSIGPLTQGHTLVVPRAEVDKWTEADPELVSHLVTVAQRQRRGRAVELLADDPAAGRPAQGCDEALDR